MRAKRTNFGTVSSKVVLMNGGLNEQVSSLELKGGELISVANYEMLEGTQGGYASVQGYERFDGTTPPSEIGAVEGDDTAREARRAAILEVPGSGPILGLHLYQGKLFAFRNHTDGLTAKMWRESTSGWYEINTSADPLAPSGDYRFANYTFIDGIIGEVMYWVDGVNKARAWDPANNTLTVISTGQTIDTPHEIATHNQRLFLAYDNGILLSSTLGDPTDWTTSADITPVGNAITSLVAGVGNSLLIFCNEAIHILNGTADRDTWSVDKFSETSGGYTNTTARLFGTVFFMDDRGVTSLEAVDAFGDVANNSVSEKIYKTLQEFKGYTTVGIAARDKNQYRLHFAAPWLPTLGSTDFGLHFSFSNKRLRGVTIVKYPIRVLKACEGEDIYGTSVMFFGSEDGMVYKMDSGTSFDGEEINTSLSTAFYHYGSPRSWKKFQSITMEISTLTSIDVTMRALFDYEEGNLPRTSRTDLSVTGVGGVWGEGEWGEMTYGSGSGTKRLRHYTRGLATNMSIEMLTSEKYAGPHTIQNLITDYTVSRRQL